MSEPLGEAFITIRPDFSKFSTELDRKLRGALTTTDRTLGRTAAGFQRQAGALDVMTKSSDKAGKSLVGLDTASRKLDAALLGVRSAAGTAAVIGLGAGALAAIALGKALRALIGNTAAFEQELNVFQATTGATANEMGRVAKAAEQLGADITLPAVKAQDAAEAMTGLAKAGLSVQESIDGARGVLQLATAAAIDNAAAVEIAANALNAFGLAGNQAERVADVLANAANAAQGSIADMGIALQQSAAVGRQVGLSFEDTSTFLTILARNGLRSSDAGTSLRTALIRLINPTDEARAKIKELGIELRDAEGNLRVDVFQQFAAATASMSPAVRDATIAMIGGQDAIRAFSILGRQSIQTLLRFRAQLRETGTAADVAAARTRGLSGAGGALVSTLETLSVQAGLRVAPAMTDFVNSITASISAISQSEGVIAGLNSSLSIIGTASRVAGTAMGVIGPAALQAAGAVGGLASALGGPTMLAGIAALVATRRATRALATEGGLIAAQGLFGGLARAIAGARTAMLGFAAAAALTARTQSKFAVLSGTFAGLASKGTVLTAGIVGLAAGLTYLLTRESATERATKSLQTATDALAGSLTRAQTASRGLAGSQRSVDIDRLAVVQANLARAQAQAALSASSAARGTIERRQLELNLAIATQNVAFATQDYERALKDLGSAQDESRVASEGVRIARQNEITTLQALVTQLRQEERFKRSRSLGRGEASAAAEVAVEAKIRERLVGTLRKQAEAARLSEDANQREIGKRKEQIASLISTTKQIPSERAIRILVETPNLAQALREVASEFGITGKASVDEFVFGFTRGIPEAGRQLRFAIQDAIAGIIPDWGVGGDQSSDAFMRGLANGITARAAVVEKAVKDVIGRAQGQVQGLERQALDISIGGGGDQASLENLQQQAAVKQKTLAVQRERFAAGEIAEETLRRAQEDLDSTLNEIEALEGQMQSDAEAAQRKIEDARSKADQAVVDALTGRRGRLENLLLRAQGNKGLGDDVKFNKALRALLKQQIKNAADRIKDLTTRRDFIRATNQIILNITNQIRADQKQFDEDLLNAIRERRERLIDRAQLDVDFAVTTENVKAEIAARRRLIAQYKKAQRAAKGNINEIKRYRNLIAEEQKAIEELAGQKKDSSNAFGELAFQFLQTQQGFAANLLGNLIPGFATGGLVGESQSPTGGTAIQTPATGIQAQSATRMTGPTFGQAATEVDILKQIHRVLTEIQRGRAHPEAHHQRGQQSSVMDGTGGGGGGGQAVS